jgi:hypothetical protein
MSEADRRQLAEVRDIAQLADWFATAALNVSACSAEEACQLLLCARDLEVQSHGLSRRLTALCLDADPPESQRQHIVFSLLRQVVLMRYDAARDQREAFFRYWLDEAAFRNETVVTIAYILGLATEQIECVSPKMRDYVTKWFARHEQISSLRVRAWIPRYLRLSGYPDEARNRAQQLLDQRDKNGGWVGGMHLSTSMLYGLVLSGVATIDELESTIVYATQRLKRGLTGITAIEATTLKTIYRVGLLPQSLHVGIQKRLASDASIFLSHTAADKSFARRLCEDLKGRGCRVWFDEAELKPGDSIIDRVEAAIDDMRYLLVVLSPASVDSSWVKRELNMALVESLATRNARVIPVLLKDCAIPGLLREVLYADFRLDYERGLNQLMRVVDRG